MRSKMYISIQIKYPLLLSHFNETYIFSTYFQNVLKHQGGPGELDGPGIESRWGARFSAPVQTQPPIQWVPGLSRG